MAAIISFLLFSSAGRWLLAIVAIGGILTGLYFKVEHDGYVRGTTEIQKKWDAAIAADIKRGEDARREAEQFVINNPPIITPEVPATPTTPERPPSVSVPNDKWNRDKSAVQPVAPHKLLSRPRHSADHPASKNPQQNGPASPVLVSCTAIRNAAKSISKATLDAYYASASPADVAHAKACLAQKK